MVGSRREARLRLFLSRNTADLSPGAHQCLRPGPVGNPPLTNRQAWKVYEALLDDDRIILRAEEPAGLESRWKQFALRDTASPKIWMDAYLAGFALAGGYRMVTTDTAFKQFPGLDLELLGKEETG